MIVGRWSMTDDRWEKMPVKRETSGLKAFISAFSHRSSVNDQRSSIIPHLPSAIPLLKKTAC
jgi:hypothetical protein